MAQFVPNRDVKQFVWTSESDKMVMFFTYQLDISAQDFVHIAELIRSRFGVAPTISQVRDRVRVMQHENAQKMKQFGLAKKVPGQ